MNRFDKKKTIIGIIGLGYVGLPLAVEFGKKFPTYGFDVRKKRIDQLNVEKILHYSNQRSIYLSRTHWIKHSHSDLLSLSLIYLSFETFHLQQKV